MNRYRPALSDIIRTISNCRRSRKMKALKGRTILAQGKREAASAPPWVTSPKTKPLFAKLRDSANLICGIFFTCVPSDRRFMEILTP